MEPSCATILQSAVFNPISLILFYPSKARSRSVLIYTAINFFLVFAKIFSGCWQATSLPPSCQFGSKFIQCYPHTKQSSSGIIRVDVTAVLSIETPRTFNVDHDASASVFNVLDLRPSVIASPAVTFRHSEKCTSSISKFTSGSSLISNGGGISAPWSSRCPSSHHLGILSGISVDNA